MRGRDPNNPGRWRDDEDRRSDDEERNEWRDQWRPGENRGRDDRGQRRFGERETYGNYGNYGNYGSAGGYGGYGAGYGESFNRRIGGGGSGDDWQNRVDWHGRIGYQGESSYDPYESRFQRESRPRHEERGLLERAGDWLQRKLGKAPKGYTRSDDRIRDDLAELVWRRGDIDASDVEIVVKDAEVTLLGNVDDRRTKRLLEDIAEDVLGVVDVHNQIKVRREPQNGNRDRIGSSTSTTPSATSTTSTVKTPRA